MGRLIEEQAVIDCLTNTAKYYEREDADEWTKGIHYGLLHGLDNIFDNVPTVEAIPKAEVKKFLEEGTKNISNNVLAIVREDYIHKADYENRLKADLVAMLEEIELKLDEVGPSSCDICIGNEYQNLIQQKINALRAESEDKE